MKLKSLIIAVALMCGVSANAQGLSDILGKMTDAAKGVGSTVGNLVEGVFTKSNLQLSDLVGEYKSTGPAVAFKSENLLKKAGGVAAAAAVETKLEPYYTKYGLTGMTLSVTDEGEFAMNLKGLKLNGTVTRNEDATFTFNFKAVGMKIGQFTAYVEKSGSTLHLMFDADKLKKFISLVASLKGGTVMTSVSKILDGYDGMCVGFKLKSTGKAATTTSTVAKDSSANSKSALESLRDLFK